MKERFNSEQDANEYKEKHQLFGREPEEIKGTGKWALNFPLEANVTVHQPHENDPGHHLPYTGQVFKEPKLIHVSGSTFTDPSNGATVDVDRLLTDYRRLQAEAQNLRESKVEALEALAGAQKALLKAMPYLPPDAEAVYCGEWLVEINEVLGRIHGWSNGKPNLPGGSEGNTAQKPKAKSPGMGF